MEAKLTQIGNSLGIILTKDLVAKLRVEKGDKIFITETPNGIEISPYDPDFARQMDKAEGIMDKYKDVLHKLAQ